MGKGQTLVGLLGGHAQNHLIKKEDHVTTKTLSIIVNIDTKKRK